MRVAIVDVPVEMLREVAILMDAGLKIEQTLQSNFDQARFLVTGDALPGECDGVPAKRVLITFRQEFYGQQRITRVDSISVIPDG